MSNVCIRVVSSDVASYRMTPKLQESPCKTARGGTCHHQENVSDSAYGSEGWGFESLRACWETSVLAGDFAVDTPWTLLTFGSHSLSFL